MPPLVVDINTFLLYISACIGLIGTRGLVTPIVYGKHEGNKNFFDEVFQEGGDYSTGGAAPLATYFLSDLIILKSIGAGTHIMHSLRDVNCLTWLIKIVPTICPAWVSWTMP